MSNIMNPTHTLEDVIGHKEGKEALQEIFDYLDIKESGDECDAPDGLLFYGYPGTGKTFMIDAICNKVEMEYNKVAIVRKVSAGDITAFVGTTQPRVEKYFDTLHKDAKSRAIILEMDEVDEIVPKKDKCAAIEGERVMALLTEIGGSGKKNKDVIILATTNHPGRIEEAFLRSGRIGMHVQIELPTDEERLQLVNKYLGNLPGMDENKLKSIHINTPRWTGSDYNSLFKTLNILVKKERITNPNYVLTAEDTAKKVSYVARHRKTNFEVFEKEYKEYKKKYNAPSLNGEEDINQKSGLSTEDLNKIYPPKK